MSKVDDNVSRALARFDRAFLTAFAPSSIDLGLIFFIESSLGDTKIGKEPVKLIDLALGI